MTAMRTQGKSFGEIAREIKLSKSLVPQNLSKKRHHESLKTGTSLSSCCLVIKQKTNEQFKLDMLSEKDV
jgi:hypothetical protein